PTDPEAVVKSPGTLPLSTRWENQRLDAVADLFVGLPVARHRARPDSAQQSEAVLNVSDVVHDRLPPASNVPHLPLSPGNLERFRLRAHDVIISCRGTILKVASVGSAEA